MNKKSLSTLIIALALLGSIVLVYHCKNPERESDYYSPKILAAHFNNENYVGSETCMECHADIYSDHLQTAHFNTSATADEENILGSFEPGSNVLDLEYATFTMKRKQDSFYQYTEFKNRTKKIPPSTFDMVIGSGVRGQSYATWKDDKLFQLQTSYHTPTDSWVNSPGFPNYVDKARPIRDACLKCHVTFAKNDLSGPGNQFDKKKTIYGIDCERCHRPAAKHVVYHRKNPEVKTAKFILPLDSLSRQKRLDVCAQCHSGPRDQLIKGNSFSFLSGELLEEYARNSNQGNRNDKPDVHGNQYGLLTQSACFKQTDIMDCATCHNPHKNQRGNPTHFNQKCTSCHSSTTKVTCSVESSKTEAMGNNCIACHMPLTPSEIMKVQLNRTDSLETSFYIRSHLIGIYDDGL